MKFFKLKFSRPSFGTNLAIYILRFFNLILLPDIEFKLARLVNNHAAFCDSTRFGLRPELFQLCLPDNAKPRDT